MKKATLLLIAMSLMLIMPVGAVKAHLGGGDHPCRVMGGGTIDPAGNGLLDKWSGNARPHPRTGDVMGHLSHTTSTGDTFEGDVEWLRCRRDGGGGPVRDPGPDDHNLSDWGGTGSWNGVAGHNFRVHADDRGEGAGDHDFYSLTVTTPDGTTLVYFAGGRLVSGNFQIHQIRP